MWLFLKNVLFTIFVPGTVAVLLPRVLVEPDPAFPAVWGAPQLAALPILLAGLLIYLRCLWDFAHRGRATPLPLDAPRVLVVQGLYRYVRNPMYLGVLLVIAGQAIFFESRGFAIYGAVWFAFVHLFTMVYEEPTLRQSFGDAYDHYCRNVSRWVPGKRYTPC